MIKRVLLGLLALAFFIIPAAAQDRVLPGRYFTTPPTLVDTQFAPLSVDTRASGRVVIAGPDSTTYASVASPADALTNGTSALAERSLGLLFNGTTWDRAFTCTQSAQINVTAAATTQVVALSASTVIRVCSIVLTMSAAGTAQIVYGTGTNCATGLTAITPAMPLATGTPLELSAPTGGSLFRGAAGNALCVAAVTGNVLGIVTYAQY